MKIIRLKKFTGEEKYAINIIDQLLIKLVAQMVKNLPKMQESRVQYLGQEDPLEKKMAAHSSTLVWRIPWTETPGRLWFMWSHTSQTLLSH